MLVRSDAYKLKAQTTDNTCLKMHQMQTPRKRSHNKRRRYILSWSVEQRHSIPRNILSHEAYAVDNSWADQIQIRYMDDGKWVILKVQPPAAHWVFVGPVQTRPHTMDLKNSKKNTNVCAIQRHSACNTCGTAIVNSESALTWCLWWRHPVAIFCRARCPRSPWWTAQHRWRSCQDQTLCVSVSTWFLLLNVMYGWRMDAYPGFTRVINASFLAYT